MPETAAQPAPPATVAREATRQATPLPYAVRDADHAHPPSPLTEPESLALLVIGMTTLLWTHRRRQTSKTRR